jgi:hypothetical protein
MQNILARIQFKIMKLTKIVVGHPLNFIWFVQYIVDKLTIFRRGQYLEVRIIPYM